MLWWTTARGRLTSWVRSVVTGIAALRQPAPRPGITVGQVASQPTAELDLAALATSPTVFAATTRLALGLATYPIRAYARDARGRLVPVDVRKAAWAGALLALLQCPAAADVGTLFPEAGEVLIAQIVADLRLTGNFYVVPHLTADGAVVGLRRLHPRSCKIERATNGDEYVVYETVGERRKFPRRSVAHGRLLSWSASGAGEVGTGAGAALRQLVRAETAALERTATVVEQGGGDLILEPNTPAGANYLAVKKNREEAVESLTEKMGTDQGRRIMAVPGDLKLRDSGFKPVDIQAPELQTAASKAELMAIGIVPVAVGAEAGTYATAVQQYRVQAEQDEQIAMVIEVALLGPLARDFARRSQGRWSARAAEVTARIDLSQHPGYSYLRTDALGRMERWVAMGWTPEQAAEIEGMDVPAPLGQPAATAAPAQPGPAVGSSQGPRRPVGDQGDPDPNGPPEPRAANGPDFFDSFKPVNQRISA